MTHELYTRISRITFYPAPCNGHRNQSHPQVIIEYEVQVSESPDVSAILYGNMAAQAVMLVRFERESGEVICSIDHGDYKEFNIHEFYELERRYKAEIRAAKSELLDQMQSAAAIMSRYDQEIQE